jgi:hypothetical protein
MTSATCRFYQTDVAYLFALHTRDGRVAWNQSLAQNTRQLFAPLTFRRTVVAVDTDTLFSFEGKTKTKTKQYKERNEGTEKAITHCANITNSVQWNRALAYRSVSLFKKFLLFGDGKSIAVSRRNDRRRCRHSHADGFNVQDALLCVCVCWFNE